MFDIIGHRKIFYIISGIAIGASILALALWQLELGIDFKGGSNLELIYTRGARPTSEQILEILKPLNLGTFKISPVGDGGLLLTVIQSDEETHQKIVTILAEAAQKNESQIEERRFSSVGPTIGAELKRKAVMAIVIVLFGISIYIAWAFRQVSGLARAHSRIASTGINSWRYGVATLVALFHDVAIPLGLFSYLGYFYGVEIDSNFIVALLVVLGFSVHDTIVVFDRIRENLRLYVHLNFEEVVNRSVNETLVRSINTSLTVLLTLLALYFFGGQTLRYFILALLVGIFSGTYSSIFIASPILVSWQKRLAGKK